MLFYTGITRSARDILSEQKSNTEKSSQSRSSLSTLLGMTETLRHALGAGRIDTLGEMLHESWMIKQSLAKGISNEALGNVYEAARTAGALGGKILGAGGGGFFLFYVPEERQPAVEHALVGLRRIPFRFEGHGTRTLYYQSEDA
jgi:D-glycero-alpha-D-manno-heptose-7-phosphate kinase